MSNDVNTFPIHVSHFGAISNERKKAAMELFGPFTEFEENRSLAPRYEEVQKGGLPETVPLAWLVVSLLGTGGLLFLKAFIEELGKKTAGKLFDTFSDNSEPKDDSDRTSSPSFDLAIVAKVSPYVVAVIGVSKDDEALKRRADVMPIIERALELHEGYYKLWPEHDPVPVVLQIDSFSGEWSAETRALAVTTPHPALLQRSKFYGLVFEKELRAAMEKANQSQRDNPVNGAEGQRRYKEFSRQYGRKKSKGSKRNG